MVDQWRSIDDLNNDENLKPLKENEFFPGVSELSDGSSRRSFLKLLGGTAALAGLSGCVIRKPYYSIVPYAKKTKYVVPGRSMFYATSYQFSGGVYSVLAETQEGRPIKLEGNPSYPGSIGSSTAIQQALIWGLYDPDRLKSPLHLTKSVSMDDFKDWMIQFRKSVKASSGKGVYILAEKSLSPSFYGQIDSLVSKYPELTVVGFTPVNDDLRRQALYSLTDQYVSPKYNFKDSNVIVSFADDFLVEGPHQLEYSKEFSQRRNPDRDGVDLNRLYVFEDRVSVTGAKADHRFPLRQSEFVGVLYSILVKVSERVGFNLDQVLSGSAQLRQKSSVDMGVVDAVVDDLISNRGRSLVTAGERVSSEMHQLVFLINSILGNNFKTVHYLSDMFSKYKFNQLSSLESIKAFIRDLNDGQVDSVFILGGNPVYSVPSQLEFTTALSKAKNRIHLTSLPNETSRLCNWVVPQLHFLESWKDFRSVNGVLSFSQPVVKPLVDGLDDIELMQLLSTNYRSSYTLLKRKYSYVSEDRFNKALHNGYFVKKNMSVNPLIRSIIKLDSVDVLDKSVEFVFFPDYKVWDGSLSNNGWLQELPDPIHKLTWDNAAFIAPQTARELSLKTGDIVTIQAGSGSLEIPVFESPGHSADSISVPLGYGKDTEMLIENSVGFSVSSISSSDHLYSVSDVTLIKTGRSHVFATTQNHGFMEGRPHVRYATVAEYKEHPNFANEKVEVPTDKSLWPDHDYSTGNQWGMSIDLSSCTSCNACITSCQVENNIPIVGKEEVLNGREMQWIRLDRYYEGDIDNPKVLSQPVTCLHCENAPCEQVCPVAATVHDDEGLNVMVYNRCVGTRYCSDNCPAKVRRFNFFDYHQRNPHSVKKDRNHLFDYIREPAKTMSMNFNPDVTVRMRGVMEKCTYCVQRIKTATQRAENAGEPVKDGDVLTACQQACPTNAIVMGNILDKDSEIYKQRNSERTYSILEQLLLKARTTYKAEVVNPNTRLVKPNKKRKKHVSDHG